MATLQKKQISVLTMNTMAFAVNFAVWVMFSVIGIKIKAELNLNETEFGLLVATPILTGSLVRLPLGILTDRYGGRIVFFIQMLLVSIPTWLVTYATEYWQYLVLGLFVGLAGGSFAVGIAYTSAWFSKERQGTAMGIFGAGNAGSSLTKFIAPMIIAATGAWQMVPKVYAVAMVVMAVLFWFFTYTDPLHEKGEQENRPRPSLGQQLMPLIDPRVWRFGLAYAFVFGGFVALALWLPKYYVGEYGLPLAAAAFLTIFFDLPSGAIRALGGWASDKWGGNTVTWWVLWISLISLFLLSYPPTTLVVHGIKGEVSVNLAVGIVLFTVLVFVVGMAQGFGKASVYRSLADHYPTQMGVVGGIVGLIGGLGGFVLPIMFGVAADAIGVRSSCFMLMFLLVIATMLWTWVAEKNEREDILDRHADVRAELAGAELADRVHRRRHLLVDWRPDDESFWQQVGRRIANRNLWLSMPALLLAFAVWVVWSVIVVKLPKVGFQFTPNQLFWLAALPGLSGALFRALYSFVVPIFGGRNWTVFSTALLLLPTLWIGVAVQDINTNYAVFVVIALLCGLGAGNFSSSMANISFFYPQRMQGTALGLNAGVGNLGVGLAQLITPIAIYGGALLILGGSAQNLTDDSGATTQIWLQNAGFIWVPFIVAAAVAAYFGMDNIATVKAGFAEQVAIFRHKHQWLMSWLYTGTFGSFIGLAASFPMLVNTEFPTVDAFKFAFIGPLLAALVRPIGGWLADRQGGAAITFWSFVVMAVAPLGALLFLPGAEGGGSVVGFVLMFLILFLGAGIGNGSTFRMIPTIFRVLRERQATGQGEAALEQARRVGITEAAATLGFSSAVAAFGGFFIPIAYGTSIGLTGGFQSALIFFSLFYLSCLFITWKWYSRREAEVPC
ncbi:MAG: MFS transporter [Candidatus Contendobacter sp.]|nr:MAG: MFS transporter [Candidatus Contendobacter sp.]